MSDDIFKGLGVEVALAAPEKFSVVVETLARVGYAPRDEPKLYQSCHLFHKQGRYAVMHFKEMFAFDGKPTEITASDIARRNTIVDLLVQWNMVSVISGLTNLDARSSMGNIMVVPFKEKQNWELVPKYSIGGK